MRSGYFRILPALLTALCGALLSSPAPAADPQRVVSLGGPITEIVYALGAGDRLVGADASSIYPAAAEKLPKVGYYRGFAVEGVIGLQPQLVLASDQAGPPAAMAQLQKLGIPVLVLSAEPTLEGLEQRLEGVAKALGLGNAGHEQVARIRAEVSRLTQTRSKQSVLLLSAHSGKLQAAGEGTAADALLRLTGARNLFADKGYKPLSAEAAAALQPEVIVTTTLSVEANGGIKGFLAQPGIAVTPAARNGRLVVMDDLLLLGFGPRLPEALRELQAGLAARP
ncbi:MAG: hemin ABC transporter substrate-binding protein [Candidatus Dactylopiibacterium carminicum]|nr:MAG: hemin ABC transporter substrate-binding protein [Candidatus Dactylopiibacterium carminicum]